MVTFVPTPIGNIDDITLRTLKALEKAEVILCEDTRVTRLLLTILAERHALKHTHPKLIALHSHNETEFLARIDPTFFDREVVFASDAGMPCISDPGMKLVAYCIDHAIPYDVLPGASAAATAFAMSGFDHVRHLFFGFLPHKGREREAAMDEMLGCGYCAIVYESPHRIEKFFRELAAAAPDRRVFAVREMTKKFETRYRGKAGEILAQFDRNATKGEWCIVVDAGARAAGGCPPSIEQIAAMDLPLKEKARLLAKVTGESPKACYSRLIGGE